MPSDEEIRRILADKGLSEWFKTVLLSALDGARCRQPRMQVCCPLCWTVALNQSLPRPLPPRPSLKLGAGEDLALCGCLIADDWVASDSLIFGFGLSGNLMERVAVRL